MTRTHLARYAQRNVEPWRKGLRYMSTWGLPQSQVRPLVRLALTVWPAIADGLVRACELLRAAWYPVPRTKITPSQLLNAGELKSDVPKRSVVPPRHEPLGWRPEHATMRGFYLGMLTAADKERAASGCPTCIRNPPPGERCPQENLGLSPTWRTREHGVGCPRRKTRATTEESQP